MVDVTPYIIVDNQKIFPIDWPRSRPATIDLKGSEEQTFGIVDRVTISKEAREKSKFQEAFAATDSTITENQPDKLPVVTNPVLTYSPKQLG